MVALDQSPEHVATTIRRPDGSLRTVNAKWVAGCDGSRSPVREMNGIGFPGAPYEQTFFVADTEATGSMKPGELNIYLWRDGFHLFFPMKGRDRWRVIGILPRPLRARDTVEFEEVVPCIQQEAGAKSQRSGSAAGSRPIAFTIAPPSGFATVAAFCWAMPPTFTARPARRA